jgi:PAS domain S-box-containing protein
VDAQNYEALLDTIHNPIVFVDNDHVIRYLNKAAKIRYYEKRGYSNLIGKSLLECHNPVSREQIRLIHQRLLDGEVEVFLKVNPDKEKITIVAVRNVDGQMLGYYERFEKNGEAAISVE